MSPCCFAGRLGWPNLFIVWVAAYGRISVASWPMSLQTVPAERNIGCVIHLRHVLIIVSRNNLLMLLCSGFPRILESPGFFPKISSIWKVLENEVGPGKCWKLKFKVLKIPGIYLWFNLTSTPFTYRTPCVNKCMKYSCCVLTEQFLCNWWWTFCNGLYCHTVYTE